jgi:glycerol uptake facilitator-like aquaporin
MKTQLKHKIASEFIGTLFLLTIIVGSGIMGEELTHNDQALTLLVNSLATGAGLTVLIMVFAPISGAHFNPLVTLIQYKNHRLTQKETLSYIFAQITGAICGVAFAHLMFNRPILTFSSHERSGWALAFSEFLATFALITIIRRLELKSSDKIPFAVGAYIMAAYWFTSSTAFTNPAVTLARTMTTSFSGISLSGALIFIIAQIVGAVSAEFFCSWINSSKGLTK